MKSGHYDGVVDRPMKSTENAVSLSKQFFVDEIHSFIADSKLGGSTHLSAGISPAALALPVW